jgi:aminoglycoside phosphotransferase
MRILLTVLGVSAAIGLTAPVYAHATPSVEGDDAGFLAALRQDGITYASPDQAVTAGRAVCTCLQNGESGLRLVHDVKTHNPGFDMENASQFAMIAAKYYCPQQLSKS